MQAFKNDSVKEELEEFSGSTSYFYENFEKIKSKHLGKHVAIKNKEVIASGDTIEEVKESLEGQGIDPSKAVIKFVSEEHPLWVL